MKRRPAGKRSRPSRGRPPLPLPPTERLNHLSEDLDLVEPIEVVRRLHQADRAAVAAVGRVLPQVADAAQRAAKALSAGGRLFYVGAGTSGRLGMLDAAECPPTFGTSPAQVQALIAGGFRALTVAVEGAEDDAGAGARALRARRVRSRDFVVGISASALTPFVRGALGEARRRKAATALVSCNPMAALPEVDVAILPPTGPELIAGSTRLKAGTATKLVLNAISSAAMVQLGKVYRGRMVDLRPTNQKLRSRAERMVEELAFVSAAQARSLLSAAKDSPRVALAMHFTGLSRPQALRALREGGLRGLEPGTKKRSPR